MEFIDLKSQYNELRESINSRIQKVLNHGQYILGPEVRELEERLAAYTGAKYCVTVASGTEALLISLMAINIKPGDEVITTPFSFISVAEVAVMLGAKPIFVDIELDTCNIDVNLIEAKITNKTRAIIPVSLYGQPSNMDEINTIAARYKNITVIEDAAQSFGAEYKGKKSCNLSTIGCTSFFPSKPLGCYGDGGAIFTSDDNIEQACREIRIHGQTKRYIHTRIGVGGRMDTLQCAIILAKLEKFDWEVEQRLRIGKIYNKLLNEIGVAHIQQRSDRTSVFAQYVVISESRDILQKYLNDVGVPTAVHYPMPINEQPAFKYFCPTKSTPNAQHMAKQVLSPPMGPYLTLEEQKLIVGLLSNFYH